MTASLLTLAGLAAAAAFIQDGMSETRRLEKLAPHFSPKPGARLELDGAELRDHGAKKTPARFRGWISVKPPKGVCFTVRRKYEEPDETICKPTRLAFELGDIDTAGRIVWSVTTGDGDPGTELVWRTPYRLALTMPDGRADDAPTVHRFIEDCEGAPADPTSGKARRLLVKLFGGEQWVVRLPDQDELLPQPDPEPNLITGPSGAKVSVKDPEAEKPKAEGHGAPAEPAPEPKPKAETVDAEEDRAVWAIPMRDAYRMSAAGFMPYGSLPPKHKGECRYTFVGPKDDPDTGRLECHDADGFKEVYMPLTCLRALRPR